MYKSIFIVAYSLVLTAFSSVASATEFESSNFVLVVIDKTLDKIETDKNTPRDLYPWEIAEQWRKLEHFKLVLAGAESALADLEARDPQEVPKAATKPVALLD